MSFKQKYPQLAKELQPLLLPWSLALLAGSMVVWRPLINSEGWETVLTLCVFYGFLGGLALAATIVFGHELQDRTLTILLTQPIHRTRLWNRKMLIMSGAVLGGVLVEAVILAGVSGWYGRRDLWQAISSTVNHEEMWMAAAFLLATVCSCGFWTLFAGSIVGGMVFTVVSQLLTALIVALIWGRIRGNEQSSWDPVTLALAVTTGLLYSGFFLWLGRKKFVQMEVRAPRAGEGLVFSSRKGRNPACAWLFRCRPKTRILNLVRKELLLQKPIAQLAATFVLFWVGVICLQLIRRDQNITYMFDIITCLFAPVSSLLAGCISLGEEKALGLTSAQLTLPVSAWLQWLIKLLVCAGTAAALSVGLPVLLWWGTAMFMDLQSSGLINSTGPHDGLLTLAIISLLMFLLGFWASGFSPNTVRAALIAIGSLVALPSLAVLGIYLATGSSGPSARQAFWILVDTGIAGAIWVLCQSLFQFRRSQERKMQVAFYILSLATVILAVSFCITCVG